MSRRRARVRRQRGLRGHRDVALHYARMGLPIFAIKRDGTAAMGEAGSGRRYPGTTDEMLIKAMWARWPDAQIALATGGPAGYLAMEFPPGPEQEIADLLMPKTGMVMRRADGTRIMVYQTSGRHPMPSQQVGQGVLRGDDDYVILPATLAPWAEDKGDGDTGSR